MEKGETPNDIISQQNERIQEYIKQRKWKLVKKYSDRKKEEFEETAYLQMKQDAIYRYNYLWKKKKSKIQKYAGTSHRPERLGYP